jgi:hypothetical protein
MHRAGGRGRVRPFKFDADTPSVHLHEQIEFGPTMNGIEPCLIGLLCLKDFFQRKSFP